MRVLVLGGAGFTGSRVVRALLEGGHSVRCLIRQTSNLSRLQSLEFEQVTGDASDSDTVISAGAGIETAIVLISLGSGVTSGLLESFQKCGIERCLFFSTTSIFQTLSENDRKIRLQAEKAIRDSGLAWTIVRPTMIYGAPGDRNIARLITYLMKRSWVAVPGNGAFLLQPVFVDDLARAAVQVIDSDRTSGRDYNLPGGQRLTFNEIVDLIAECLRRRVSKIHLPVPPVVWGLSLLERLRISVPVSSEQVRRLNEHKVYSLQPAQDDFGYRPRSFRQGVRKEVQLLRRMQQRRQSDSA